MVVTSPCSTLGSPGGFSICLPLAVPSLSSLIPADTSSQMCPFCCQSTPKTPHLRVAVERRLLAGTIREAPCSSAMAQEGPAAHSIPHLAWCRWQLLPGRGAGLSREVKTCNSYCDKEHSELFLQSESFLCPLYSLWLLDHNPLHLVPRIQLNAIYCHMFE